MGRKGAGEMAWIGLIIVMIAITAGFYLWQNISIGGGIPTNPEQYADAWKSYGDEVFAQEGQPWRMVGLFFFPLLIYFSMYYFAFSVALIGLRNQFSYIFETVQRPVVVLSFAVAFIMLPFPLTYSIYGFMGGLSPILLVFAWVIPIVGLALVFYGLRGQFRGGTPAAAAPVHHPIAVAPPGAVALPPAARHHFNLAAHHLGMLAAHLQNAINNLP